jgi:cysteine synthase
VTGGRSTFFDSSSSALCPPSLIGLGPKLVIAAFRLMKILPAKFIIEGAIERGELHPDYPIVESSSGTFALGMGIVCAEKGLRFHVVSDAVIDSRLQELLLHLGGKVQIVGPQLGSDKNIQLLRLEALQQLLAEQPHAFWTKQYDNLDNQRAYRRFAEQLLEAFGTAIVIVATVGSGGSSCGTVNALREVDPSIELVGVDTFGSVLFGLPAGTRQLRGMGNSILPGNLDHACFDEVHWVSAADVYYWTRRLHSDFGLFCGPTSGAAYQVARQLNVRGKTVVFLAPDEGYRYINSIYSARWLRDNGFDDSAPTQGPLRVSRPALAREPWSSVEWNRRTLSEVTGGPSHTIAVMP